MPDLGAAWPYIKAYLWRQIVIWHIHYQGSPSPKREVDIGIPLILGRGEELERRENKTQERTSGI